MRDKSLLKSLVVKGDKNGLKDPILKRTIDDYHQRLNTDGRTADERLNEFLFDGDDKTTLKLIALR